MMSDRGQILPMAMVMTLLLALFWVMLLNVGKLITDRVQMQIAADTAVQSACAIRARALNSVGLMNAWLGIPGFAIGAPHLAWWPVPRHAMGTDVILQKGRDIAAAVKAIKKLIVSGVSEGNTVNTILTGLLQGFSSYFGLAYDIHPRPAPNYAALQQKFIHLVIKIQTNYVKTYGGGLAYQRARQIARLQGADDIYVPPRSFSLGLTRNHGDIWYLSTLHVWFKGKPLPPAPSFPDPDYQEDSPATVRWYEQGPNFHRKAMRLYAFRRPNSPANGPFPLGPSEMPYLYTVAAARVYNPDGPMFPSPGQTRGEFGGLHAATAYAKASDGWYSQLVPVGGIYEH